MDIKYNMPYVKKSQMHIVYTQIHTKSVHTQLQSVSKDHDMLYLYIYLYIRITNTILPCTQ